MKKSIAFGILFAGILASVAAVLQSGWTSTTNPVTARTALNVPGLTNNNSYAVTSSNFFAGPITSASNINAVRFAGSSSTAAQILASGWDDIQGAFVDSGSLRIGGAVNSTIGGSIHYDGEVTGILYVDNLFNDNTGDIQFRTKVSGTPVNALTIEGGGNVGIGVVNPTQKLDVGGRVIVNNDAGYAQRSSGGATVTALSLNGSDNLVFGQTTSQNDIMFNVGGVANALVVQATSGNVGIGTVNPASGRLVVDGGGITFGTDNAYGIGAVGANRPAFIEVAGYGNFGTYISARTNIAQFDVTITDFVIGTRYTNSNRRSFVAASFQLAAAVAGTAAVTFSVEQAGTTNKLTVSSGPLAGLTTIEPLALLVGPGAFYYFTDTSSGAGAVASIVAGTSSQTGF